MAAGDREQDASKSVIMIFCCFVVRLCLGALTPPLNLQPALKVPSATPASLHECHTPFHFPATLPHHFTDHPTPTGEYSSEVDALRRRLAETEAAMERVLRGMDSGRLPAKVSFHGTLAFAPPPPPTAEGRWDRLIFLHWLARSR